MTATLTQARDEILGHFKAAWDADGTASQYPIRYWAVSEEKPTTDAWVRITVAHVDGGQATLSGATGQRRFRHFGVVTVQVFTKYGDGLTLNDQLCTVAKNAFEGEVTSPGRVIFRNVRLNEVGQDDQWFQTNVLADFEYDEIR